MEQPVKLSRSFRAEPREKNGLLNASLSGKFIGLAPNDRSLSSPPHWPSFVFAFAFGHGNRCYAIERPTLLDRAPAYRRKKQPPDEYATVTCAKGRRAERMTVVSLIAATGIPLGGNWKQKAWTVIAIDRGLDWHSFLSQRATLVLLRKHFHGQRVRNHLGLRLANNDTLGSLLPRSFLRFLRSSVRDSDARLVVCEDPTSASRYNAETNRISRSLRVCIRVQRPIKVSYRFVKPPGNSIVESVLRSPKSLRPYDESRATLYILETTIGSYYLSGA